MKLADGFVCRPLGDTLRCSKKQVPDSSSNCKYQVGLPLIPAIWFALLLHKYSTARCLKKHLHIPPAPCALGAAPVAPVPIPLGSSPQPKPTAHKQAPCRNVLPSMWIPGT